MNPKKTIPKNIPPDPENPFRVPEGYFDDVRKRAMARIRAEEQSATGQDGHRFHDKAAKGPLTGTADAPLADGAGITLTGGETHQARGVEVPPTGGAEVPLTGGVEVPPTGGAEVPPTGGAEVPLTGGKAPDRKSGGKENSRGKKIYLQPYLTLAATIAGVALVVYIVLQSVVANRSDEVYDIATLDRAGVIQDESILAETFTREDDASDYSEWDEEAIVYLASNEVDLLDLLDTN